MIVNFDSYDFSVYLIVYKNIFFKSDRGEILYLKVYKDVEILAFFDTSPVSKSHILEENYQRLPIGGELRCENVFFDYQ